MIVVCVQTTAVVNLAARESVERQHGGEDDKRQRVDEVFALVFHTIDADAEFVQFARLQMQRAFDCHDRLPTDRPHSVSK